MSPDLDELPYLRFHIIVDQKYGKKAFREVYERPDGELSEWVLFEGVGEPCVVIFAVTNRDGKHPWHVATVKHFRYGASEVIHELPGGGVKNIQTPKEAVRAELKEETGLEAEIAKIESLGKPLWFEPAAVRAKFRPMIALDVKEGGMSSPGKNEFLKLKLVPIEKWFRLIASGKINDSKSISVSLLAIKRLPDKLRLKAMKGFE